MEHSTKTAGAIIREKGGPTTSQELASMATVDMRANLSRLPPHSLEAEQGALSCCLLDPNEAIPVLMEKTVQESFYDLRHQLLRKSLIEMFDDRSAIDTITIQQHLKDRGQLEAAGGLVYIMGLMEVSPSAHHMPEYVRVLREKLLLRKLGALCATTMSAIWSTEDAPDDLINQFEAAALNVRDTQIHESENKTVIQELIQDFQDEANGKLVARVQTGIADFDRKFLGYPYKSMVVIGGGPSTGKTAIGLAMAVSMARAGVPVGIISLEMPQKDVIRRMVANASGVDNHPSNLQYLANSKIHQDQQAMKRIVLGAGEIAKAPIRIVDTSVLSVQQIASIARRWVKRHGTKVVIVDYMQLVKGSSKRGRDDRRLEIAEISSGMKAMAKALNIVVIVLTQLNREVEKRGEASRPRMADIREAGEIEQDADFIQFLWAETPLDEQKDRDNPEIVMSLAKQRNGPTGDVKLIFRKALNQFHPVSRMDIGEYDSPHRNE